MKNLKDCNALWECLDVALGHARKLSKSPVIYFNMQAWVTNTKWNLLTGAQVCEVCLAGAVMYNELGVRTSKDAWPFLLSNHPMNGRISAINCLRLGHIVDAAEELNQHTLAPAKAFHNKHNDFLGEVFASSDNPQANDFAIMQRLHDLLKQADL